jgi:hypothetical protein
VNADTIRAVMADETTTDPVGDVDWPEPCVRLAVAVVGPAGSFTWLRSVDEHTALSLDDLAEAIERHLLAGTEPTAAQFPVQLPHALTEITSKFDNGPWPAVEAIAERHAVLARLDAQELAR